MQYIGFVKSLVFCAGRLKTGAEAGKKKTNVCIRNKQTFVLDICLSEKQEEGQLFISGNSVKE
ncbi:hypothetical protein GCM10010978_24980 [Compostibacillus humi]|uniref:Uncharacterized protein n=1 Tax=Compostibacillus humi TaxID=1245525 RepID=A0A8J2TPN9_9BACI|nr:hypothetical protein GCM10010978_24980 [Compostibacillus humi]